MEKINELKKTDLFSHWVNISYLPRWGVLLLDLLIALVALVISIFIGDSIVGFQLETSTTLPLWWQTGLVVLTQCFFFWVFHTYSGILRYSTFVDTMKVALSVSATGVLLIVTNLVVKYAVPLVVLIIAGALMVFAVTFFFGRRLSKTYWFERTIFAWGWWTGTMAMGIALIRIVDPKLASKAMDDFALAYLPIAPVEILLITFVPVLFINGMGLELMLGCLLLSVIIIFLAHKMGWWIKKEKTK